MSIPKLWKNKILKIGHFLLIFLLIAGWIFSGWPQIWHNPAFPPTIQKAQAAAPTFVVCGAQASGTAGITPAPGIGRTVNDIDLLFIETANEAITLTTPAGFAEMTFVGTGTAGALDATRMTVFWRRWDGVAGSPTTGDPGNHQIAVICSFRGVIDSGNPWNIFGTNVQTATTAGSINAVTTTVPNALIIAVNAGATPDANSTAEYSGWANVNLTGLTEQFDVTRNAGNGGAIGIATGVQASAGSTGITTFTTVTSAVKANMHIALSPPPPTFGQAAYRLFNNLDSTDVGTALAAQDTTATLGSAGAAFRLRMLIRVDTATLALSGQSFHLQFAARSDVCDTGFVGETYADVTATTIIAFNDNPAPLDGAALTANANDPVDGARTISNQTYEELNPFTNAVSAITAGQTGKWDFSLRDNGAPAGTAYCLRIVLATGAVLNTYTVIPEITTFTAVTQTLTFSLGANSLALGTLSAGSTVASSHTVAIATNAANGVVITYSGATLTSGAFTITAMSATAASAPGTEQFGLNAMANTTPAVGAACTGTTPIASAAANYNTANSFRFVSGETIVSSTGAINSTTCTISYIANITGATEAGSYNTTLTYTATAQF